MDLDGEPAVDADGMTVTFGDDGSINGFGGCNTFFGDYTVDGSTMVVEGLAATRKFCEQELMDRESLYIAILTDASSFAISGEELTITASDGAELIFSVASVTPGPLPTAEPVVTPEPVETGAPSGGELVGPTWALGELMGQPMPTAIIKVTVVFAPDGTLSGFGGCNDYTGTYSVDGQSISIADITPGTDTCDATSQGIQDGLLQVMPFIDTWSIVDGDLHLDSSFGIESVWVIQ